MGKSTPRKTASRKKSSDSVSYKDAGVDLEVYQESMARLPALMHRTFSPRVMKLDGGFAGLFQLDGGKGWTKKNYKDPVLVSGTDGVGTKLKIAKRMNRHDTVGIDLVAMCANDIVCCGAEPLFFLDYVAMSHDDPKVLEQIVTGISEGCSQAECALLGGETAIMPDLYRRGEYDLAGFVVGVVEKKKLIDGTAIREGDRVIALGSTGVHSNGFSLVRKIVFEKSGLKPGTRISEMDTTVGELLLTPTRVYVPVVNQIMQTPRMGSAVHGIAHITGGGLAENVERILPKHLDVKVDGKSWAIPPVFPWLKHLGNVKPTEMYRVFNMGIGMTLIVSPSKAAAIQKIATEHGIDNWLIGEVTSGKGKVRINGRRIRS